MGPHEMQNDIVWASAQIWEGGTQGMKIGVDVASRGCAWIIRKGCHAILCVICFVLKTQARVACVMWWPMPHQLSEHVEVLSLEG